MMGFDGLVGQMDSDLLDSQAGLGHRIRLIGDREHQIDADLWDPEQSVLKGKGHGRRISSSTSVEVRRSDLPDGFEQCLVRLDFGGIDYAIGSVELIDRYLCVLHLVPRQRESAGSDGWVKS